MLHYDPTRGRDDARLITTAYIASAAFANGNDEPAAKRTLNYRLRHRAETIKEPYTLALIAKAIAEIDRENAALSRYLDRLDSLKQTDTRGGRVWWSNQQGSRTVFYGSGRAGDIEATVMATLALLRTGNHPRTVRGAMQWLVAQMDSNGTWHSTQATVLALKALVEGTGTVGAEPRNREIVFSLDGRELRQLTIPADQSDVMQQLDFSQDVETGEHRLAIGDKTRTGCRFQLTLRYHLPEAAVEEESDPISIDVVYDRRVLRVEEHVNARATIVNNTQRDLPMVMVDLPIPGGFVADTEALDKLLRSGAIEKYEPTARQIISICEDLSPLSRSCCIIA
jgi:hypothetical protein